MGATYVKRIQRFRVKHSVGDWNILHLYTSNPIGWAAKTAQVYRTLVEIEDTRSYREVLLFRINLEQDTVHQRDDSTQRQETFTNRLSTKRTL